MMRLGKKTATTLWISEDRECDILEMQVEPEGVVVVDAPFPISLPPRYARIAGEWLLRVADSIEKRKEKP